VIEIVNRATGQLLDADSIPGLAEIAALHDEQLLELRDLIEGDSSGGSASRGPGSRPVVWAELSAQESAQTWEALAAWVGWLRGRYPLAQKVPLCWWRHPELVEELTALWLSWREAYVEKGAPLSAGADWHGRWLPEAIRRIRAGGWNIGCEGEHRPVVETLYDGRAVDDHDAFRAAMTATAQDHGGDHMLTDDLTRALAEGRAKRLGELPGAPIELDGAFWVETESGWSEVEDDETVVFLRDAQVRLKLAMGNGRDEDER
jgi:hypothetical protein